MALHIYKISEYDHAAERQQFAAVAEMLRQYCADSSREYVLIGNCNVEGAELDALLIGSGGIRLLEFKNWGGQIVARENGSWTADGMTIEGGAGRKTPFEQIRLNKSRATRGLGRLLGVDARCFSAAIVFLQDAEIDDSQLSETVGRWLTVCDNRHLGRVLEGMDEERLTTELVRQVPQRMRIAEFDTESERPSGTPNETYEPEAPSNFFEELERAANHAPDYRRVYNAYDQTFQKCLNQRTSQTRLNLGGAFAKTDYLLKENGAPNALRRAINNTRVRLRKRHELTEQELEQEYLHDLRNLCRFVAFVYDTAIPASLAERFPTEQENTSPSQLMGECLRVIVERWNDTFIYVQTEQSADGEPQRVAYRHGSRPQDYDWSYLKDMLHRGTQLNLVRPREENGTLWAELIIYEPDYLVNISTVAHCFTNYADSPFVELIKKLEPAQTSEAIVLGNLAGQLLDEEIHQMPNSHSYAQSVKDFFRTNALSLLMAGVGNSFHSDAQRQKHNIAQAMGVTLPQNLKHFNSKEGIVEPSFFSEMLGLQGRMDYLQLDYRVLLEQKSGKGGFPYDNFVTPRQTDEHYVQLLLYMTLIRYNYREAYERNGHELHAFLLYSKYTESLLGLGFSPELIFKAFRVRNGLAWAEMLYAQPNGYRILDGLTADHLNQKRVANNLWVNYQRPQIENILLPIQTASDLEKAYFFRFLTFIANEHTLSKLGNKTKESSGFAATWHDSLEEKRLAGNIYDQLTLLSPTPETEGRIETVELQFAETEDNDMANFRTGDIVILYPYEEGHEPDARRSMVFRCTIEDIATDTIDLRLRATQADNRVFVKEQGKMWAIEHDFMEASYSSLYKGMHAFLLAPQERRDLLLMQREPQTDPARQPKGEYGNFNELATRVKRACDLFLIIGPPGTGKTSFGMLYTVEEELKEPDSSVLLLSYTNRAVDEICSKLVEADIDFIRIGNRATCAEEYRDKLLSARVQESDNLTELKRTLTETRVFVGTTSQLNSNVALFTLKQFSLAVIDEASQILEPHLIGLLSAHNDGVPAIRKFVLIGDQKQLPAVVQQQPNVSRVDDPLLNEIHLTDCRLSLFERLLKRYGKNRDVTYMLTRQGRMHRDIALFPNYAFYGNRLEVVPLPHQTAELPHEGLGRNGIADLLATRRIAFVAAETPENSPSDKVNQVEADIIAALVVNIYRQEKDRDFDVNRTVGVIVPYRNQITTVRKTIDQYGIKLLHDITIDTVERYQGSQRKYIIYGFTIQKYYQLNFLTNNVFEDFDGSIVDRKLNVAMTRAEEHLLMVGNPELLSNNFTFYKLIAFVRSKHGFFRVDRDDFVRGNFNVPQYEIEDTDLGHADFVLTTEFERTFEHCIIQPLSAASDGKWPTQVMGSDMATNLNAIGYGRIGFTHPVPLPNDRLMDPEAQVLVYGYYLMRQHYCCNRSLYLGIRDWLRAQMSAVDGRVQLIDMGCGPGTCGMAFAEVFLPESPSLVYTGVDISEAMRRKGTEMLDNRFRGRLHSQMKSSFGELGNDFWAACSELPSLVIFNMADFFPRISAQAAERLARRMESVMQRFPLNKYVFLIQHGEFDSELNAYCVFRHILAPHTLQQKSETGAVLFSYNQTEQKLNFAYDILVR